MCATDAPPALPHLLPSCTKSSLDRYAKALLPELGQMAPYLLNSRNREGAWIQCRLRSNCLPLMATLSRQCRPPRPDVQAQCLLCPPSETGEGNTENVSHFLSECRSASLTSLRLELCSRLQQAIREWQQQQRDGWAKEWKDLPMPAGPSDSDVFATRSRVAEAGNGVAAIRATLTSMQQLISSELPDSIDAPPAPPAGAGPAQSDWCELILGRRTDRVTGRRWDESLLQSLQLHTQNFLLLAWRARAAQLGGVPTLLSGGRGITLEPYRRMKNIGVRPIRRPTGRPLASE